MPISQETPGQTKDTLKRLYLSAGSGMSCPPWRSSWKWPGRGAFGSPFSGFCPRDPDLDKQQKTKRNETIF